MSELGPDVLGDLGPGQQADSSLSISGEPSLAGVAFDGYVMHFKGFDCGGSGPTPHSGESGEGSERGESGGQHDSSQEHSSPEFGGEHERLGNRATAARLATLTTVREVCGASTVDPRTANRMRRLSQEALHCRMRPDMAKPALAKQTWT